MLDVYACGSLVYSKHGVSDCYPGSGEVFSFHTYVFWLTSGVSARRGFTLGSPLPEQASRFVCFFSPTFPLPVRAVNSGLLVLGLF